MQQERLSKKVKINFSSKVDKEKQLITPLLFISFIENAIKYSSILKGRNHLVKIDILLEGTKLLFKCQNSFKKNAEEEVDLNWKKSGVGIKNTKKRLQLLYPKRHQLKIKKVEEKFEVILKIEL